LVDRTKVPDTSRTIILFHLVHWSFTILVVFHILANQVRGRMFTLHTRENTDSSTKTTVSLFSKFLARAGKVFLTVMLALILLTGTSFSTFVPVYSSSSPIPECTLSILYGTVEVQEPGSSNWEQAVNGMSLITGTRVRTAVESRAMLIFFEGSTITLDSDTIIEIRQLDFNEKQSTMIILKQWLGRTWSRVVKMVESGSYYEVETPSATAVVRGTQFLIEVDEVGATRLNTTEGLVSVIAQGEEVYVSAGQQTAVEPGYSPSEPTKTKPPKDTKQNKDQGKNKSSGKTQGLGLVLDSENTQGNTLGSSENKGTSNGKGSSENKGTSNGKGSSENKGTSNAKGSSKDKGK